MKCFKCRKDFGTVDQFLSHIQIVHRIKGEMRCTCTLCFSVFGNFTKFKRHLESCSKNGMVTNMNLYDDMIGCDINDELEEFNEACTRSALLLTLKMCSKHNFPRSAAFDIVNEITSFIKKATDGMKTVMMEKIDDKNQQIFQDLTSAVESAFEQINTEAKLIKLLNKADLIAPIVKIDVALNKRIDGDAHDEYEVASDDDEEDGDGEEGVLAIPNEIEKPKCTLVLMPIAHQIKQFFELPNVFDKIRNHMSEIMAQEKLNHFIKGSVWQEKIKNYGDGQIVIPYNFYVDGIQLNNQLGPHTALGLENFNYISFPAIPSEYQSKLSSMMVTSLFQEKTIKEHKTRDVYSHVISELAALAHDGIVLNINNQPIKVFFVMGIFEGDNKEQNRSLDYPEGHNANYYCRFCRMIKTEMCTACEERVELRRTEDNYNEDVETNNMTLTGVKNWSIFNSVPYFHVVNGTSNDLPHDVLEGVLAYSFKSALKHLINEEYFTVTELNKRIKSFNYGFSDPGNIPPPISETNLNKAKKKKIKMNAAEMFNFCQNITFLIGDLILSEDEEVNPVWEFVKTIVKLLDVSYLPWYEPEDIINLRSTVKSVNEQYTQLFEELKPVFHYLIHYPENTKKYGPLRYVQSIRKEAKHKEMKMYTKNSNNRLNISVSVAKKIQYKNALRAYTSEGLEDTIETNKLWKCSIKDKPYFRNILASKNRDTISARECSTTYQVVVNGIAFRTETWLPDFTEKEKPKIFKIGDIVLMNPTDVSSIYFICKVYDKISYEDHFVAHSVDLGSVKSHLTVINLKQYLDQHQYPVVTHTIDGREMFRCKRF